MSDICGAKTRAGGPCQRKPRKQNGRCRLHGGLSTGAPKGNRNALKHGIYAVGLLPGEEDIFDEIPLGTLDDELRICRLQLRRCLVAMKAVEDARARALAGGPTDHEAPRSMAEVRDLLAHRDGLEREFVGFELTEYVDDRGGEAPGPKTTHKRPDYRAIAFRLIGRIRELEVTRAELIAGKPADVDSLARDLRDALAAMDASVDAGEPT